MTAIRRSRPTTFLAASAGAAALALALTACAGGRAEPSTASGSGTDTTGETEVAATRLVATYDGGVLVLEGDTLEVVADLPAEGFLRVNPAGDGRRVFVSTDEGFRVLDTGVTVEEHGDHDHFYAEAPELTDLVFPAEHPGHVTVHAGTTALFADGTGEVALFESDDLRNADAVDDVDTETYRSAAAHHGVAVALEDGGLLTTVGTEDSRSGAIVLDADRAEIARTDACPGVHGETVAAGGVVVLGCEDGAVVWRDGAFTKIAAPDAYGRIGNQAGSPESSVVLGDYKTDPDAELERPTRIALIDTASADPATALRLVDLGTSYTFRSLARGAHGEALVLGTDGAIHVIDPATGAVVNRIPVVEPWTEPMDWQSPRPTITVDGHRVLVTDPEASAVHVVDLEAAEVVRTAELPHVPNELTGVGSGH
ncbi:zinc metallochaperone AztD [Agromyces sp. G08B096]|uniref:Zinc metallochaperone AztD n=1 Tax=Agromyces sp. G08B096 TaxID=3156399 RepID=A0AAU7WA99_9MICO